MQRHTLTIIEHHHDDNNDGYLDADVDQDLDGVEDEKDLDDDDDGIIDSEEL